MNKVAIVVAVFALILGGAALALGGGTTVVERVTGVNAGPEVTERQFFMGGATVGRNCYSTTTTGTMTASTLEKNSCITIAAAGAGQGVVALTLPASTSMSFIPKAGDCTSWFIDAGAVAAATTTTIVAGTGHNVVGLDATGAGTGADVIDGAEYGRMISCRQANTDILTFVQEYIHAD